MIDKLEIELSVEADTEKAVDDIEGLKKRLKDPIAFEIAMDFSRLKQDEKILKQKIKDAVKKKDLKKEIKLTADLKILTKQLQQANRELQNYSRVWQKDLSVLWTQFDRIVDQIKLSRDELIKLWKSEKEIKKIEKATDKLNRELKEWAITQAQYKKGLQGIRNEATKTNSTIKNLTSSFLSFFWITYLIQKMWEAWNFVTSSFRDFETAFAGFRKTLNATESEFKAIEVWIVNMSKWMPKSVEELSKIAELWGQMWIASKDILIFTKTVAQLSTAIDWISAEEASIQLARLIAQTWWSIENLDRLGASLVDLWNKFKANEWEILNFSSQIQAAGWIAWLSAQDILWISAAFVAAWIKAEAWWSAVSKALLKIDDNVNQSWALLWEFARVSWKTVDQFKSDWTWDSATAFADILEWIKEEW